MIHLSNIKKHYVDPEGNHLPVINLPSLQIMKGEQVAMIGPSGCGKSTLLHMIAGVIEPDEGDIMIDGINMIEQSQKEKDIIRAEKVGYIFQEFYLIPSLTAEENVKLALSKKQFTKEKEEELNHLFERVGILNKRKSLPQALSRGQQQRVALIRALIHNPKILLADEPTGSLDRETAEEMMHLLLQVSKEYEKTFVCVTHDLTLAQLFSTTIKLEAYSNNEKQGA